MIRFTGELKVEIGRRSWRSILKQGCWSRFVNYKIDNFVEKMFRRVKTTLRSWPRIFLLYRRKARCLFFKICQSSSYFSNLLMLNFSIICIVKTCWICHDNEIILSFVGNLHKLIIHLHKESIFLMKYQIAFFPVYWTIKVSGIFED
jgi:hypothetical protein